MTSTTAPLVVIGGGVIGCAVLWELARWGVPGILLDAELDIGEGTSKANSAILHTGFDARPGTLEARALRRSAELWPSVIDELGVPYLRVGAIMVARSARELERLASVHAPLAASFGVAAELLDRRAVLRLAPYLSDDVLGALSIPDEGVIDPFWLTRAYAEGAVAGGATVELGRAVVSIDPGPDAVAVGLADGTVIRAEQVIDAAGLHADAVAQLAGDDSFTITPRKGQFLVSEETFGVDRIVLPIPGKFGKGMLVTPIVFGGLLLGPTATDGSDKADRSTDGATRDLILDGCRSLVPALSSTIPVRQFAGLRHVSSTGDFIVRPSAVSDRMYLAAGIRSTGISASPAVAEAIALDVMQRRRWKGPSRPRRLAPAEVVLPDAAGEVICICRAISRGEVEAACRRPIPPRTLDALKRRSGVMFGDCQGNLCALDVAGVLAVERGIPLAAIEKHRSGSRAWERAAPAAATRRDGTVRSSGAHRRGWTGDVIVVGGGAAGRAAAVATGEAALRTLVLDRAPRPSKREGGDGTRRFSLLTGVSAVGLSPDDGGWLVLGQGPSGATELRARSVIVATGSYVEPREQRSIGGPRPAGVMTADLADRLLAAGLRPGRRVVVVGRGRRVAALAAALRDAGSELDIRERAPDELAGEVRLKALRFDAEWTPADALVLADRAVAQAFLLRGLGLVDGRPGSPAPVDGDGRLPRAGLWAAGCCVRPDIDHDGCSASGAAVGRRVAAALLPARTRAVATGARG